MILTLQDCGRTQLGESRGHKVSQHLDVVMVSESILHVIQELENVQSVKTRVQQGIHALKRCFSKIQSVVHRMLERTHLDFSYQFFLRIEKDLSCCIPKFRSFLLILLNSSLKRLAKYRLNFAIPLF